MMKTEIYKMVQDNKRVSLREVHRHFHVNPDNEEDRVKVWRIGQAIAELFYAKWIVVDLHRNLYAV